MRDEKIDFSDSPELTDEQLERARRVGRPPLGDAPRELIAIRIDPTCCVRYAPKRHARESAIRRSFIDYSQNM